MKIIIFIQSLLIVGLIVFSVYSYQEHKKSFQRDVLQSDVNHAFRDLLLPPDRTEGGS